MADPRDDKTVPRTVDEAVNHLMALMSPDDLAAIRAMSERELTGLHFSLGMAIRNRFGLWRANDALMASCASVSGGTGTMLLHPDDASGVIIEAQWRRLQEHQLSASTWCANHGRRRGRQLPP